MNTTVSSVAATSFAAREDDRIVFQGVSKFYGETLGVNGVDLSIPPGITTLVGPNGSGKTTLMNLMTGLVRPTRGRIRVLGVAPDDPERLFPMLGYVTQYDSFPRGLNGFQFVYGFLRLHGRSHADARRLAWQAIAQVGMEDAAGRPVAAYSKGMRQRIKLAQAIAHQPRVLVLDEPLNGLDPLARAEVIALLRTLAGEGRHIIVSSHILHEVDRIADQVILLAGGCVVAEGPIQAVRRELDAEHPHQILVRCRPAQMLAARVFQEDHAVAVRMHEDRAGLLVTTRAPDRFYELLNRLVLAGAIDVEAVTPADEDVHSVYRYLIGAEGDAA